MSIHNFLHAELFMTKRV